MNNINNKNNNNNKKCFYCEWEILPNDLSKVIIDDKFYFHTACYNHVYNMYQYIKERTSTK